MDLLGERALDTNILEEGHFRPDPPLVIVVFQDSDVGAGEISTRTVTSTSWWISFPVAPILSKTSVRFVTISRRSFNATLISS